MNSPNKFCSPQKRNVIMEKSLEVHLKTKKKKECVKWGSINAGLLAILIFDMSNKCPYSFSRWYYVEYAAIGILSISVICYLLKYLFYLLSVETIKGSEIQRDLLHFDDKDSSFLVQSPAKPIPLNTTHLPLNSSFLANQSQTFSLNCSYNNTMSPRSSLSPTRNASFNTSMNQHNNSYGRNASYSQHNASSNQNNSMNTSNASFTSPYKKYNKDEVITNESELHHYISVLSKQKETPDTHNMSSSFHNSSISSLSNYFNSAANLLKTSLYQLSPSITPMSQKKPSGKEEGKTSDLNGDSEMIKRISSEKLFQYVANLRMWLSITVLQRIDNELNNINNNFKSRGFSELQIGHVGLERLKKTVENQPFISQHVPALPLIIPFLEMSANQEYLVKRIRDLAKGSCLADYRWNSGNSYHGLPWDEHLPTDSSIVFHLFCTYMDSQLKPLPPPGGRPFFNRYVIMGDKKTSKETIDEVNNKAKCAILCTNILKPKFNFISDGKIHNCTYDRNNLLYVIIQFLIYMKTTQDGLLDNVNLGKRGVNILCAIED